MDRKAELEKKKQKLAALREEKERRRREKETKDVEDASGRVSIGGDKENRRDLDEMLSSLGVAPVSEVLSSLSSVNTVGSDTSANATPDGSLQPISLTGQTGGRKKAVSLSVTTVQATNIPPKETVVYTKQTQTSSTGGVERDEKLKGKSLAHYDFAEKLSRKWDEMNMKRMMSAVLAKKFIDPEVLEQWSKPEKDRVAYNEQKQKAIAESFGKINEDIVELRSILPVETNGDDRVTIIKRNIAILDEVDYECLKETSMNIVNSLSFNQLDYLTILKRGRERRQIINDSLSSINNRRPGFYIKKNNEVENSEKLQINGKT